MLVTNDVALLTFVPFAALVLGQAGLGRHLLYVVVLQTVAANLGSMATPVGNPQNLYLFSSVADMGPAQFVRGPCCPVRAPCPWCCSAVALPVPKRCAGPGVRLPSPPGRSSCPLPCPCRQCCAAWPFVPLLPVHRAPLDGLGCLPVLAVRSPGASCWWTGRPSGQVDYGLLLTFAVFFHLRGQPGMHRTGSAGQRPAARPGGGPGADGQACCASQVISNVPAAVLLSGFTGQGYRRCCLRP